MNAEPVDFVVTIMSELRMAADARANGNEGRARVLARRAAGWAIRESHVRRGMNHRGESAYQHLQRAALDQSLPSVIRGAAAHLLLRINEDHELPIDTDVLDDARALVNYFLASDNDRYHA